MERKGRKSTPPPGKAESSVQRGRALGAYPGVPGATSSVHRLRFVEAQVPGGLPLGASRSPGPSSTIALAACRTLLTSLGSPPPQGVFPSWLLRRPGGSGGDQVFKAARTPGTPGAPFAARGSAVPSIHQGPRSRAQRRLPPGHRCTPGPGQLRQGAGSSESAFPGGSGSDGHFLTPAVSRERGSASPPLTTSGPPRDGEIAGMVGTAPLGR
ncbi:hypothetical protein NDU88_006903 [Pleurodeles waltl]|uniref:Uncharacterized protein n=1 Tax=Pleurodeles waltl TaxID=8319 RepID=A0AAV7PSL6_PLEWA|nr:hypothetical protein NDU88_006903 [Pleurodeles waltl]